MSMAKREKVWGWGVECEALVCGEKWIPDKEAHFVRKFAIADIALLRKNPGQFRNIRGPIPLVERKATDGTDRKA